jgi:hypothetical protein
VTTVTTGFRALRKAGLVARQRFMCCSSCAHTKLCDQHAREKMHRDKLGYVFFHLQDAARFAETGVVHIRYSVFPKRGESVAKERKRTAEIGKLVEKTLRAAGLTVRWDGNPKSTILAWGAERRRAALSTLRGEPVRRRRTIAA